MKKLLKVMRHLRSPKGCPWDRKQTLMSLRRQLLEETHEVLEAVDEKDPRHIEEELGDLMAVISMMITIGEETHTFSQESILKRLHKKLIHRHPHVFGDKAARTSGHARELWERAKLEEKGKRQVSLLDGIAKGYPSLMEAYKIGKRVSRVGFDWKRAGDVLLKIEEEMRELKVELKRRKHARVREEIGDFLFTTAHLARLLRVDPEVALLAANRKFQKRFRLMEKMAKERGLGLGDLSPKELERLWQSAKRLLK